MQDSHHGHVLDIVCDKARDAILFRNVHDLGLLKFAFKVKSSPILSEEHH